LKTLAQNLQCIASKTTALYTGAEVAHNRA